MKSLVALALAAVAELAIAQEPLYPLTPGGSGEGVSLGALNLQTTRLEDLPEACFHVSKPVAYPTKEIKIPDGVDDAPYFIPLLLKNYGAVMVNSIKERSRECFGDDVDSLLLYFRAGKLRTIAVTYPVGKAPLNEVVKRSGAKEKDGSYRAGDLGVSLRKHEYTTLRDGQPGEELWLTSERLEKETDAYLEKVGYPRFNDFVLGQTTSSDLEGFIRKFNLKPAVGGVQGVVPVNFFGYQPFGSPYAWGILSFNKQGVLYAVEYQAIPGQRMPAVSEVRAFVEKLGFVRRGTSDPKRFSFRGNELRTLWTEIYEHPKYSIEATGGECAYRLDLLWEEGREYVEGIEISSPRHIDW